jgi:hypothetical protein
MEPSRQHASESYVKTVKQLEAGSIISSTQTGQDVKWLPPFRHYTISSEVSFCLTPPVIPHWSMAGHVEASDQSTWQHCCRAKKGNGEVATWVSRNSHFVDLIIRDTSLPDDDGFLPTLNLCLQLTQMIAEEDYITFAAALWVINNSEQNVFTLALRIYVFL